MTNRRWKTVDSELALNERWFKVLRETVVREDGSKVADYFTWLKGDVSLVVPVLNDGTFVLVKQYKHGLKAVVTEFPAGYIEAGESPLDAARRETVEETGYRFASWSPIGIWVNDATKERGQIHVFEASIEVERGDLAPDEGEFLEVLTMYPEALLASVIRGEVVTTATIAAALQVMCRGAISPELRDAA
jgi:8-oxo-dGTP pyrophosphatase MutT (NUDIX family)